jgi:hypothetical protein
VQSAAEIAAVDKSLNEVLRDQITLAATSGAILILQRSE